MGAHLSEPWRSGIALALLTAAPLLFFWRGTLGWVVLAPGDGAIYSLPLRLLGMDMLRSGDWPLWNPFVFSGFPLFGQMQSALLYPGTWLMLVLSPAAGMNWQMLTLYMSAALGTFAYTRAIGCRRAGAVFAGLTFSLGGFLVAHLGHVATPQGAACLPWFLWSLERLRCEARFRFVLAATLALALAIVAGHPPTPMYLLLVGGLYVAWFGLVHSPPIGRGRFVALSAIAVLAAYGSTAVQLWPTVELAGQSVRAKLSFGEFVSFSLPLEQLPLLLFPFFFGGSSFGPYWGSWNTAELTGYVGIAPLMLAVAAIPAARRNPHTAFWAGLAGFSLVLALGDETPLAAWMFHVPGYNLFRAQARNLLLFDLSIAVLAARALSAPSIRALTAGAALVLATVAGFAVFAVVHGGASFATFAGRALGDARGRAALADATAPDNPALWLPLLLSLAAAAAVVAVARRPTARRAGVLLALQALDLFLFVELFERPKLTAEEALEPTKRAVAVRSVLSEMPPSRLTLTSNGRMVTDYRWALWGVPLVNGYDPFLLSRYRQLLDDMPYWGLLSAAAVAHRPWAFDVLNSGLLLLDKSPPLPNPNGLAIFFRAPESVDLVPTSPRRTTSVELRTALVDGVDIPDEDTVARLTLWDAAGGETTVLVRAGAHTAQWTWDASGGAARIRHRRAPLPEDLSLLPPDAPYYRAILSLPQAIDVTRLRLEPAPGKGRLALHGITLRDEGSATELPLGGEAVLRADPERWKLRIDDPAFAVYENRRAQPRAWLVRETVALPSEGQLATFRSGRLPDGRPFDPRAVALVEDHPARDRGSTTSSTVDVLALTPDEIELETRSPTPAFLVLSEIFYPGWIATIDEAEVPIVRTNHVLRGLEIPRGLHYVRFSYRPASVRYGAAVSALCAAALLGVAIWRWQRAAGDRKTRSTLPPRPPAP